MRLPSYDTCTLCFKYSCSLSSLLRTANKAGIQLDDVVLGDMNLDDKRQFADNNGEEEVDDTLINFSKKSEDESDSSSAEDKDEEGSVEIQESSSELDGGMFQG